jgi:hypothetical protein
LAQVDVIMNITGNVISGQVMGDTAKQLSERFGKIMQDRSSLSINRMDTSVSKSKQLEAAVPASKIAALSSGGFVGMVADDPSDKIELKTFHCSVQSDHKALNAESEAYQKIPQIRQVDSSVVQRNYGQVRQDIMDLVDAEMGRMMGDEGLKAAVVKKYNTENAVFSIVSSLHKVSSRFNRLTLTG